MSLEGVGTGAGPPAWAPAATPEELRSALAEHGYLADLGLATAVFLAIVLRRPLLLEGAAGVGKTEVGKALARWTGARLIRLQCYEGIDVSQAVYEWDYSRQLLHLRAAEARGSLSGEGVRPDVEDELYSERFLVRRPLLAAIAPGAPAGAARVGSSAEAARAGAPPVPPVLLVDEVDRADDEFEAFLLEILSDYSVTVPELGTFTADDPPLVVITSNRTRDVHDALKRRCLYHWVEHPGFEREVAIVELRAPGVGDTLARQVAAAVGELRSMGMYKPPGVAETIVWAEALAALGAGDLNAANVEATLGTVLKYREDAERLRKAGIDDLVRSAVLRSGSATNMDP
ncbi:MAG: AAA family ATPase [Acidimicrobiales bacterium]